MTVGSTCLAYCTHKFGAGTGWECCVLTFSRHRSWVHIVHCFVRCGSAKQEVGVGLLGVTGVLALASHQGCQQSGPEHEEHHPAML
jgi:hypothetical protein